MDAASPTSSPDPSTDPSTRVPRLGPHELAVLQVFLDCRGRVVSRLEIARRAGLTGMNQRRCDSVLVTLRRVLGAEAIRTVRGRGWMLELDALERANHLIAA
jgi:DNA-binding response OmpR family regulator